MRFFTVWIVLALPLVAETAGLTLPPSGDNQRAEVVQYIGPVRTSINYSSPKVHGPDGKDRRGKIWGKLVSYGLVDLGFGTGNPAPWRAGANENTVFTTSADVKIEGKPLAAGRYGFHIIAGPEEWTLIFSKTATAWGSFFYDAAQDALRVTVKPHKHEYREYLTYEFLERKPTSAVAELQWEDLAVSWKIDVPGTNEIYISKLREELANLPGFQWTGFDAAAQYCLTNNTHLEQGLLWAEAAIGRRFIGQKNFTTLGTKAAILSKLGRTGESDQVMAEAVRLPGTLAIEIHQYGRRLLTEGKAREALAVFELNHQRNGDAWPIHVGLARAYSAVGDLPKALASARQALAQAPDPLNKQSLETMVERLSAGQPVNN